MQFVVRLSSLSKTTNHTILWREWKPSERVKIAPKRNHNCWLEKWLHCWTKIEMWIFYSMSEWIVKIRTHTHTQKIYIEFDFEYSMQKCLAFFVLFYMGHMFSNDCDGGDRKSISIKCMLIWNLKHFLATFVCVCAFDVHPYQISFLKMLQKPNQKK